MTKAIILFVSQSEGARRPEDNGRPDSVAVGAKIEALTIINDILIPRIRDTGEALVIAEAAIFRMAVRLEEIAASGKFQCEEEPL